MPTRPRSTKVMAPREPRLSAHDRGYDHRWQQARLSFLADHPLCECEQCKANGLVVEATVVDHVIPHKGDRELFWDRSNWQAMAKPCHDRKTMKEGSFTG